MAQESDKATEMILRLGVDGSKILDTATKAGVAYLGYKSSNHWTGALTALIALRLASGGNLAGGVAGIAVLTGIGLHQIIPPNLKYTTDPAVAAEEGIPYLDLFPLPFNP